MYPFERFTESAKKVLILAQEEAERSHRSYIGTEHLLLGLLRESGGAAAKVLRGFDVTINDVRSKIDAIPAHSEQIVFQQPTPTPRVLKVIECAFDEARRCGDDCQIGAEHLLLGLLIDGDGVAAHALADLGVSLDRARERIAHGNTSQ